MRLMLTLLKTGLTVIALLFNVFDSFSSGKDTVKTCLVEFKASYGFVIQHHMDMGVYTRSHFPCMEVDFGRQVSGNKAWHASYGFPAFGLAYWYSTLGNNPILGDVHAIFFWERIPVIRKKGSAINVKIGAGSGYFKKKFDRYGNYKNLAIGSHLNVNLQMLIEYRQELSKNLDIAGSIGLAHFSNGTMVTPNYGINVPNVGLVLSWKQVSDIIPETKNEAPFIRHWTVDLSVSNGVKQILPVLGGRYLVFAAGAEWVFHRSLKGGFGAGGEVFWDGSERAILKRDGKPGTDDAGLLKPGIDIFKTWEMGRLNLNVAMGVYLYEKETSDGTVYHKIGMKYFLTDRIFAMMYLKTHYARADFIGWGLGIRLRGLSQDHEF